jgi:Asp-tRNA(Asn)/Glu-tRNA(Gln) amidotransferase A subunit family amidase
VARNTPKISLPRGAGALCAGLALFWAHAAPACAQAIDVSEMTVDQVAAGYAEGRFTAVELTRAFLDRIARYEGRYNAFISMNPDALATAASLDVEYAGSGPRGPLHGVPVVIKDNIDYGGLVTTAGWEGFSSATGGVDMIPDDDAAVVTRLRDAGAIILGKTNLPDFAGHGTRTNSSVAGLTLNPYNVDKVPGGSSGGTATAVNASFAVLGLGTETGGSIQNPSSAQALVGVKPTYGLVPLEGVVPLSGTYVDVVGPMARTVRDAARTLDVLAGPTTEDLATFASEGHMPERGYLAGLDAGSLAGKRFGLVGPGWRTDFLPLDDATAAEYEKAVDALRALGAEVVEDPFDGSGFVEAYGERTNVPTQGSHDLFVYLQGLGPNAPFRTVEEWEALSGREWTRGQRRDGTPAPGPARPSATEEGDAYQAWRFRVRNLFRSVLEEHELDGLFFPQSGTPNRPVVEDPERPDFAPNNWAELPSNIINDLGVPTVTVPYSYFDDGTPFVLAFIGDMWTEAELLSWAYAFEQAHPARVPPVLEEGPGR